MKQLAANTVFTRKSQKPGSITWTVHRSRIQDRQHQSASSLPTLKWQENSFITIVSHFFKNERKHISCSKGGMKLLIIST
jgi:hypothetical protein